MVMKKSFIAFLIIAFICSCKNNDKDSSVYEPKEKIQTTDSVPELKNTEPQVLERDNLVSDWAKELEQISLDEKFQVARDLVENRHIKGVTDTVKTFRYKETSIHVYHTKGLYAVESADINNPEFTLKGPVQIGINKNQLEKVLNSDLNNQIVQVKNELGTLEFNFFIKNNILQKIQFKGYVD